MENPPVLGTISRQDLEIERHPLANAIVRGKAKNLKKG